MRCLNGRGRYGQYGARNLRRAGTSKLKTWLRWNIQTARRHIRGNKEFQTSFAVIIQRFHALRLIQIPMNGRGLIAVFVQRFCTDIHIGFAIAKMIALVSASPS